VGVGECIGHAVNSGHSGRVAGDKMMREKHGGGKRIIRVVLTVGTRVQEKHEGMKERKCDHNRLQVQRDMGERQTTRQKKEVCSRPLASCWEGVRTCASRCRQGDKTPRT